MKTALLPSGYRDTRATGRVPIIIAGLTVAGIVVLEGRAYAQVAGVAAEAAFYTAPPALAMYALSGSSGRLVATSGAIAALSATIIGPMADGGSDEFVALTAALAMFAGVISVLAGRAEISVGRWTRR